jgi:hypothetical protein
LGDPAVALRREQLRILLASVPILLAAYFLVGEVGSFSERPYVVALVLFPLLAVVVALGLPLVRERRVLLGGGFLPFFVVYCLFFSIAAGTRVLEGRRTVLAGFEGETPSNVLGLSRLGDWHYLLAPRAPPAHDLVVITLPSFAGRPIDEARQVEVNLIAAAVNNRAKGIAFDYELAMPSRVDRTLCFRIRQAESASIPVVLGYMVEEANGTPVRRPLAPEIDRCVPAERLGTLTGLKEWDGRVRMVPTSHLGDTTLRSFSYRVATLLAPGKALPHVGLTQFVAPVSPLATIAGAPDARTLALLRDRFVLVGSHRPGDIHATPYDSVPGVMIHAYAANSLRHHHVIQRLDVRWILPAVFALCYVLILLQAGGGGVRALLIGAGLMCLAIVAAAALAMRVGLLWVDASYPLLAVGTLTAMLSGGARLQRARVQAPREAAALAAAVAAAEGAGGAATVSAFDVFLSHNSKDKPAVIELASALRDRQLRVWLDVWELVPGRPWQEAIEQVITTVRSGAVLVGKDGLGPWEEPEMRACLDECVRRRMPVIPVLLPGVPAQPKLPLFLRGLTWVDLRGGFDAGALDRLEWGITGIKPRQR